MTLSFKSGVNGTQLQRPQAMNAEVIGGYARCVLNQAEVGKLNLVNQHLDWYGANVDCKGLSVSRTFFLFGKFNVLAKCPLVRHSLLLGQYTKEHIIARTRPAP